MWNVRCIWKSLVDLTLAEGSRKTHALRLKKNLYGTHQAGRVWNQHLHKGLIQRGYVQSLIDLCVYYKGKTVFMVYVDNGIFSGPDSAEIDELISSLANDTRYQTYQITDEGPVEDYLGVHIQHLEDGRISLTQPHLIRQILEDLGLQDNSNGRDTPAPSTQVLRRDDDGIDFQGPWHYRSVIGKLNFLEKSTRGELAHAVHQCARFSTAPKVSHVLMSSNTKRS
jgi:hypothetical protein